MVKKRRRAKRRSRNFGSMVMVSVVLAMILLVVFVRSSELREKKAAYEKREEYLLGEIAKQEERSLEIEEYGKYIQTLQYIEDMAKEKLGLVHKDEIVFEAEN